MAPLESGFQVSYGEWRLNDIQVHLQLDIRFCFQEQLEAFAAKTEHSAFRRYLE